MVKTTEVNALSICTERISGAYVTKISVCINSVTKISVCVNLVTKKIDCINIVTKFNTKINTS